MNALKLSEPQQAFTFLYQHLYGKKLAPAHAQALLDKRFAPSSKSTNHKPV
jgi:hypothetical protein